MSNHVITTTNLGMRYGRHTVLNGLNLEVPKGSVYALVGSNGAGKTTTLQILMNLLRGHTGAATVLGVDSRKLTVNEYARIGYVSEGQEMPDAMTVAEFLAFWRPFYPTWDNAREQELLQLLRLPLDRKLKHLSRGMRMKAALISSLSYRPELIVLDEPFSGLDPLIRDEFIEGLLAHADESTILISSHDLAEIESFSSHVGLLEDGHMAFSEETTTLTNRFREIEVRAEIPALPPKLPSTWVRAETTAALVRFVETQWHPERTAQEIKEVFPTATAYQANAMPLRAIFVALAKAARKAA
jgi:ABC-2 type transport system ATP-binding protein